MIDDILTNFKTTVQGIVPDTMPGIRFLFLDAAPDKAAKTGASDRRFFVAPDDGVEILDSLTSSATIRFRKIIWVIVQYNVGQSLAAFLSRVHQDADRMAYTLSRTSSYCSGTDYRLLSRLPASQFLVETDDLDKSALVHIPFEIVYSVTYA